MRVLAVINPGARSGRNKGDLDWIRRHLKAVFPGATLEEPEERREARRLVERHGQEFDLVIAAGGDGTINEIVTGLLAGSGGVGNVPRPALAVLPLGTGNDLARTLGIQPSPKAALEQLRTASRVRVDTGLVRWYEAGHRQEHVFINVVGIGLDAHIAHMVHRVPIYKKLPRGLGYSAAIFAALRSWTSPEVNITLLEGEQGELYSGPLMFVTVGNARYSGAGFCINPQARLRDGLVDACIVKGMPAWRALRLLPSVKNGKHVRFDDVLYKHVAGIRIRSDMGLPIHCDGEVPTSSAFEIEIRVVPASLDVLVPASRVEWI